MIEGLQSPWLAFYICYLFFLFGNLPPRPCEFWLAYKQFWGNTFQMVMGLYQKPQGKSYENINNNQPEFL